MKNKFQKLYMHIQILLISSYIAMCSISVNAIVISDPMDWENDNDNDYDPNFSVLERTYHNMAKKFPEVCAILIKDPNDDMMDIGTGTYFAKNENSGFVVTAAHVAIKATNKLPFLFLAFVPKYQGNPDRIAAKKIYINPNFNPTTATSYNDIAIIEFDISKLNSKISPLPIDFDKDYDSSKCLEGVILGYGHFGTTTTQLVDLGKVHYAETYMSLHEKKGKLPIFKVELPHLSNFYPENELISKDPYRFASEFAPLDSREVGDVVIMHDFCKFQVHSNQGFGSEGDSGGPLLMKNKNNSYYRFVGIARFMGIMAYGDKKHSDIKTAFMEWEPLFIHKQWIKEIIKEKPATFSFNNEL